MPIKIALEHKASALAALEKSGDVAKVAQEFGISKVSLRNWSKPKTLEHSASDTPTPATSAALEFWPPWPELAPYQVVSAGHRTFQDWLEVLERHAPRKRTV